MPQNISSTSNICTNVILPKWVLFFFKDRTPHTHTRTLDDSLWGGFFFFISGPTMKWTFLRVPQRGAVIAAQRASVMLRIRVCKCVCVCSFYRRVLCAVLSVQCDCVRVCMCIQETPEMRLYVGPKIIYKKKSQSARFNSNIYQWPWRVCTRATRRASSSPRAPNVCVCVCGRSAPGLCLRRCSTLVPTKSSQKFDFEGS